MRPVGSAGPAGAVCLIGPGRGGRCGRARASRCRHSRPDSRRGAVSRASRPPGVTSRGAARASPAGGRERRVRSHKQTAPAGSTDDRRANDAASADLTEQNTDGPSADGPDQSLTTAPHTVQEYHMPPIGTATLGATNMRAGGGIMGNTSG